MKFSSNQQTVSVLFVCVILFAGAVFSYRETLSLVFEKFFLYVKYRAGANFYQLHSDKYLRSDERLLSVLLFENTHALVAGHVEPLFHDPSLRILSERKRSFSVFESLEPVQMETRYGYRVKSEYQRFLVDPWDDILFRILACRTYGYSDRDFSVLASIPIDGAYADTHKLLGLILLREQNCYNQEKLDRVIRQGAEHIARFFESDTQWSDLFSERVVFLYWAGEGSLVKSEWIEQIADAQESGGSWADPSWGPNPNAHSTGLSMLAIRYFLDGNPAPDFFAPLDSN